MARHFALADYAPKRRLQAGSPLLSSAPASERPNRNQIAASLLLHLLVLFGLFLLPQSPPAEVIVPLVTLRIDESGAAGAAGGKAGGGGGGGHGTEASSAPTPQKTADATSEPAESAPEPQPPEPAPPEPTPPEPAPQTPTPPTPEASPLPPAPQAVAPKPKPHPRPVVKPRAVKPEPPAPVKPAETPTPPSVATEPPPGPANGPGPPAQNPQPGTAASGTANTGPGGAAGVGTGAAGAGRGVFGDGRGLGDDYLDRLRRHLAKYKHYPPEAVKLKEEGTALVEFVLARDGTVLEAHIQRSSGFPLLDQATLDMVRNASPVPPVPDRFVGDRVSIAIPTAFKIGLFDRLF